MAKIISFFKNNFLFLIIIILALLLRTYRLSTLTTFGGDQGQDFLVVRDMVLFHKWTLLGIKTSVYSFFQGPLYLYMLLPFFALFKLQSISGAIAAVFYSSVTLIFLYLTVKKYFSVKTALISSALFAVSPQLVIYGNTPLYQHFLPLFIVLSFYLFLIPKKNMLIGLLLGLTVGLGMETHLLNISLAVAFFLFFLLFTRKEWKVFLGYTIGVILGLSPTILFELKHDFLNTRFLLNYHPARGTAISFSNILNQWFKGAGMFFGANSIILGAVILLFVLTAFLMKKVKDSACLQLSKLALLEALIVFILSLGFSAFEPHYILPFWLLLLILIPVLIEEILPKKIGVFILGFLILINLTASIRQMNINHGYTMPERWTLKKIDTVGTIISQDSETHPNFNVASLLDSVTRAYPIRYSLAVDGVAPEPVENYPSNNFLYLVTRSNVSELNSIKTWEVTSFIPFRVGKTWDFGEGIYLYRLDRVGIKIKK